MFGQAEEERQHQQQMMVIKGKRTKRQRPASPLTPLVAMSNSSSSHDDVINTKLTTTSSSSTTTATTQEEEDMAHCLILLAQGGGTKLVTHQQQQHQQQQTSVGVMYECKTCNRCFPSFQALGGHRASHKKPKMTPPSELASGMGLSLQLACNSSNTLRAISFNPNPNENLPNKPKSHACGICGAKFSSGQALGGHMRRHRPLVAGGNPTPATPPAINLQLCLDLNLPAEEQEDQEAQTPKFLFGSNENTLVFTTGALVECRY